MTPSGVEVQPGTGVAAGPATITAMSEGVSGLAAGAGLSLAAAVA